MLVLSSLDSNLKSAVQHRTFSLDKTNTTLFWSTMSAFEYKISTHVLDINKGRPVTDLLIKFYKLKDGKEWIHIGDGKTASSGRCADFGAPGERASAGTFKLRFETRDYYVAAGEKSMYPFVEVVFEVERPEEHHHIPLLLSAHGYTTYRGS